MTGVEKLTGVEVEVGWASLGHSWFQYWKSHVPGNSLVSSTLEELIILERGGPVCLCTLCCWIEILGVKQVLWEWVIGRWGYLRQSGWKWRENGDQNRPKIDEGEEAFSPALPLYLKKAKKPKGLWWRNKKATHNAMCLQGCLLEMQNGTVTLKDSLAVSHTAKHIPYDPAILFLGIYLREMKTYAHTKTCARIWVLFIIASRNNVLQWAHG